MHFMTIRLFFKGAPCPSELKINISLNHKQSTSQIRKFVKNIFFDEKTGLELGMRAQTQVHENPELAKKKTDIKKI